MSAVKFNASAIQQLEMGYADYLYRKYVSPAEDADAAGRDYMNKVFMSLAELTIKNELAELRRATEVYEEDPKRYPALKTEFGYPEVFRCKHICFHKNKYWRCKQKKNKGDADYCTIHLHVANTHEGVYHQMCVKAATATD